MKTIFLALTLALALPACGDNVCLDTLPACPATVIYHLCGPFPSYSNRATCDDAAKPLARDFVGECHPLPDVDCVASCDEGVSYCEPARLVTSTCANATDSDGRICVTCWRGDPQHETEHFEGCIIKAYDARCVVDCSECGGVK